MRLGKIVPGAFTPVLAKHTKNLSLVDILAVGVDRRKLVEHPKDWPWSSWTYYAQGEEGLVEIDPVV